MDGHVEVRGERTGRVWRYHPKRDHLDAPGVHFKATTDEGEEAYVRTCEVGTYWDDEIERLRNAVAVASRPEVANAPTIVRLLDVEERHAVSGEFGYPGKLSLIWEYATQSLHDLMQSGQPLPEGLADSVERPVREALEILHALGLVHLDVAPNNILLVAGAWKLGDLDICAPRSTPTRRGPINERWCHPGRRHGTAVPAREEFDFYGLDEILRELRARSTSSGVQ